MSNEGKDDAAYYGAVAFVNNKFRYGVNQFKPQMQTVVKASLDAMPPQTAA